MNQLVEFLVKPFLTEDQAQGKEVIAVVPGGYKPPTLGHYYLVDQVSKKPEIDKTLVLIGHKERDGITKEDALDIWNIYENHLTGDIDIRISDDVSPIKELFSLIGDNPDKYFVLVVGVRSEEDLKDVKRFDNLKKKFNNLEVVQVKGEDAIRGTNARKAILDKDFIEFNRYLPVELTDVERDQVWNILTGETETLNEDVNFNALEKVLDEMFDDLDIDINFTKHFKERVLERGLTEEDVVELMSKIHDKYGDEVADLPKDSNRVFTHLTRLVDISSAMGSYGHDGLRDLYLTTAYKRKNKNEPEFRTNKTSPKLQVAESYKGKRTNDGAPGTLKAKISKLYGGDVTIEKAKKLKNRENATAHDKRQANWFINFHSKNENVISKEDEPAAPYGSGYKKLKEEETRDRADFYLDYFTNVSPSTFNLERQGDDIHISNIFADYPEGFDDKHTRQIPVDQQMEKTLMPYVVSLTEYMVKNGLSIDDAPEVHFVDDPNNAEKLFGRTAFYDPNEKSITLYVTGRHPKDILRSFAHEMIHYCQDCENRLHQTYTTDVNEDDRLMELEREAYERGNMYFRSWENSLNEDDRKGIKAYSLELAKGLEESKSRYNVPVKELAKKIFTAWKDQYEGKEGTYNYSDNEGSLTSKTGNTFYFELDANLKVEKTPDQIYAVEEPTGVDPDVDPEEGDPTFDINIKVDPRDLPKKWPTIYFDLIDIVRHEIEHLTHFGPDALDVKRLPDDKILRLLIDKEMLPKADYFRLTAEVDAMLQGMALKAKKKKEPFAKTLNDYLDIQIDNGAINQEEKEDILNLWRKRAPALSLPKF
jgi:phosphopantetheine adenylyltransferase